MTDRPQSQSRPKPRRSAAAMIFIMAGISAIGPFSVDAYLPALPIMAEALDAAPNLMQLTMSVYLLGIAVFPMILTPLSDAYGRKPVLAVSLLAYTALSGACALAPSAEALIAFRLLQAAAGGTVMTCARAVVADQYSGNALSRAMSQVMLIFTIAPVVAPLAGGVLLDLAGWRAIFFALVVYGILGFLATLTLNETLPPDRRSAYNLAALRAGYMEIARSRDSRRHLFLNFWIAFYFFAFLTSAPFIFVDQYGFTPVQFSYVFGSISAAAFAANMFNARLVMRRGHARMLRDSVLAVVGIALVMGGVAATGAGGPWGVYGVMICLMAAFHIQFANTTAGIMQLMPHRVGTITAVLALFRFIGGALGSAVPGLIGANQTIGLAVALGTAAVMMVAISMRMAPVAPNVTDSGL